MSKDTLYKAKKIKEAAEQGMRTDICQKSDEVNTKKELAKIAIVS